MGGVTTCYGDEYGDADSQCFNPADQWFGKIYYDLNLATAPAGTRVLVGELSRVRGDNYDDQAKYLYALTRVSADEIVIHGATVLFSGGGAFKIPFWGPLLYTGIKVGVAIATSALPPPYSNIADWMVMGAINESQSGSNASVEVHANVIATAIALSAVPILPISSTTSYDDDDDDDTVKKPPKVKKPKATRPVIRRKPTRPFIAPKPTSPVIRRKPTRPFIPPRVTSPVIPPRVTRPVIPPRDTRAVIPPRVTSPVIPPRVTSPFIPLPNLTGAGSGLVRSRGIEPASMDSFIPEPPPVPAPEPKGGALQYFPAVR